MKELTTTPTNRKLRTLTGTSAEVAALDGLLSIVNAIPVENPPGARPQLPDPTIPVAKYSPNWSAHSPGHEGEVNIFDTTSSNPTEHPAENPAPKPALPPAVPPFISTPAAPLATSGRKIFFTGRMYAGKDYLATQAQRQVFGLADPMYGLANHFFGVSAGIAVSAANKDQPGMREFLQKVGQWGRGTRSAQYPLTTERAVFITMILSLDAAGILPHDVDWKSFGDNEDIWLDSCVNRIRVEPNAAVTNVRFENEFKRFKAEGFQHWHVMCSGPTWTARLGVRGLQPGSPEVNDVSEQLAISLDTQVTKKVSQQRVGPKLHVVWSDAAVPAPSARFYTVAEFLQEVNS